MQEQLSSTHPSSSPPRCLSARGAGPRHSSVAPRCIFPQDMGACRIFIFSPKGNYRSVWSAKTHTYNGASTQFGACTFVLHDQHPENSVLVCGCVDLSSVCTALEEEERRRRGTKGGDDGRGAVRF